ncbi:MAG: hypothetical protein ACREK8_08650, partial [Gemmatimonadales bacterium]
MMGPPLPPQRAPASPRRRYALLTPSFPEFANTGTGVATYARLVAEALTQRGWSVDVVLMYTGPNPPASANLASGVRIIVVPMARTH